MSNSGAVPKDGRAARSYRARRALAEAVLDLLNEGVAKPTAMEIARRAGVSLRLVFHHFDDLEAIYASAADLQFERIGPLINPIDRTLAFDQRVAAFVRQRARLFEYVTPVRRAGIRMEESSGEIARRLRIAYEMARDHMQAAFSRELAALSPDEAAELSAALDGAASWEMWDFLRRRRGLSVKRAGVVVERMIRSLLADRK